MQLKKVYLDYAATTPPRKEAIEAMLAFLKNKYGNPSSLHTWGREAKEALRQARQNTADLIGARPQEIIFTSGGTEANNHALFGTVGSNENRNHIIISQIEHHSILYACKYLEKRGFKITYIPVDRYGTVDLKTLEKALDKKTALVSIMHSNNEIGTIQPLCEISQIIKEASRNLGQKIYFHTDAVQSAGMLPIDVDQLGVDLLSLSSHKIYGPKGVGALYIRDKTVLTPLLFGGDQEYKRRASTENVPGIAGFGKACELAKAELSFLPGKIEDLRDKLLNGLLEKIPDVMLNGHKAKRLPNNINLSVKYIEGESMLIRLDLEGIAASTGSACSSNSLEPSHVLLAIGLPHELAHGSVRFSLGKNTTEEDINYVLETFPEIVYKLRKMSPLYVCE